MYSDDLLRATVRGKVWLNNSSLFREILNQCEKYIQDNGRVFPIHQAVVLAMPYFVTNIVLYKTVILLLVLANLVLFGFFVHQLTGDWHFSALLMLLLPLFFQFRLYHDPILSFHGVMQLELALVLLAMICHGKYLESGKRSFLALGVLAYATTLLMYEISIPLVLLFPAIALLRGKNRGTGRIVRSTLPYAFAAATAALLMIAAAVLRNPGKTAYAGTTASLDLGRFVGTLVKQFSASVPLSYYVGNPSGLFRHDLQGILDHVQVIDVAAAAVLIAVALILARGITFQGEVRALVVIGAILALAPAGLIALSAKYQKEIGRVGKGIGYLPVYLQYFGMLLAMAGGVLVTARRVRQRSARTIMLPLFLALIGIVSLLNMQSNRLVVEKANIDMHYRREALASALRQGALNGVPDSATICILDDYTYDPFQKVQSDLYGWVTRGFRWRNNSLVAMYAKRRMRVVDDFNELAELFRRWRRRRSDPAAGHFYVMRVASFPERFGIKEGYVTVGRLEARGDGVADQGGPLFGFGEVTVFNTGNADFLPEVMSRREFWFEGRDPRWTNGNSSLWIFHKRRPSERHLVLRTGGLNPYRCDERRLGLRVFADDVELSCSNRCAAGDPLESRSFYCKLDDDLRVLNEIRIVSSTFRPADVGWSRDEREFGLDVSDVMVE